LEEDILATTSTIRGMLLEEAVLRFLAVSGYTAVCYDISKPDPTLAEEKGALFVCGRGEKHQIDALADFFLTPPFSHRQRLILEAKCYASAVDLPVLRNAGGVLRDISEYWSLSGSSTSRSSSQQAIPRRCYHYQYSVISTSGFTREAQNYAFAHDIFLISLAHASYFQAVRQALSAITPQVFGVRKANENVDIAFVNLRQAIRKQLNNPEDRCLSAIGMRSDARYSLELFCQACQNIKMAVVATLEKQFPFFLLPRPDRIVDLISNSRWSNRDVVDLTHIRLRRDREEGWIIEHEGEQFFSFDIPTHLLKLYLQHLPRQSGDALEMQALVMNMGRYVNSNLDNSPCVFRFQCSRSELQRLVQGTLW
jgi:hypothetical protein